MSKKSARNNHYSKKANVKGYTEKEKKILIVVAAVIVVAALCVVFIPRIIEANRYHYVGTDNNGLVKGIQDNWLITDLSDSSSPKYVHLADVSPAEGYTLAGTGYLTDENVRSIYFQSEEQLPEYFVMAAKNYYSEQAESFLKNQSLVMNEVIETSELKNETVDGKNICYFWANGTIDSMYDEDGNEITPEKDEDGNSVYPEKYELAGYCYVESPIENISVLIQVVLYNREANEFPDPQTLVETMKNAVTGIQFQE